MCPNWREDWAQIGGVLQGCLSFCKSLPSVHTIMDLIYSDRHFLVTSLTKALLHQLLGLASSRKSPGCSKLLLLWILKATWLCEPSMQQNFFLNSSPDVWLDANQFLSSTGSYFDLGAWFLLRTFIKMCVPFQIIHIRLNLPQFNSAGSVVAHISNMSAPELNFNCYR